MDGHSANETILEMFENDSFETNGRYDINKYKIVLEASEAKENFVVEEAENIIQHLETIYRNIMRLLSEPTDKDSVNLLLWTLDKSLEATLGITRVASSSIHNLGRAIYFSNREKSSVEKNNSSGYFSTLRYQETNPAGKALKRSSILSFEECIRMFSDLNPSETLSHQTLSSIKLKQSQHMDTYDHFELHDNNSYSKIKTIKGSKVSKHRNVTNLSRETPLNSNFLPNHHLLFSKVASFHVMYDAKDFVVCNNITCLTNIMKI